VRSCLWQLSPFGWAGICIVFGCFCRIWFCEKNSAQATELYALSDFKVRKGREDFECAYLSGRFGALPFIKEFGVANEREE